MRRSSRVLGIVGAAVLAAAAIPVIAGDEAGNGETVAPAVPLKPQPAELAPLAAKSLLLDVVFTGERLIAVGDRGDIVASLNGKDWAQVEVPVRATLTAVYFSDSRNGWAVGHDAVILQTVDGGRTWKLQNFQPELEKPFLDVLFLDAQRGFAVGAYGLFYMTEDGGEHWAELDAPAIRQDELHFNAITKLGNGELFIAGEQGMLGVSKDEGKTWERLTSPYDSSLFGALPVGDKGVVLFGLRGNVYVTQDVHGNQWQKVATNTVASLFGGTVLPDGQLAMVGLNGTVLLADGAADQVQALRVRTQDHGSKKDKEVTSTFSSAIAWHGGLLVVGEEGVQNLTQLR